MRREIFSISAFNRPSNSHFFAMIYGAQQTEANLSRSSRQMKRGTVATRNGSLSIRMLGMGHGFVYQFWTGFFACDFGEFNRSTDSGATWMSPINIPNSPDTGAMAVDTNGNLFLAGGGAPFWCVRSSNAQNGGQTPTFDQVTQVNLGGDLIQGGVNGIGLCGQ